jgi:hypothetical protein
MSQSKQLFLRSASNIKSIVDDNREIKRLSTNDESLTINLH